MDGRDKGYIRKKKGHLKIHVAVDVKTKKILSMKVTDEHVHDSKVLSELVENIIESDRITTIGKIFVMGPLITMMLLDIYLTMGFCCFVA